MLSKAITTALTVSVVVAASSGAQAHRAKWHGHGYWPAYLPYDYLYEGRYGYSRYDNCYLVEYRAPDRPYLVRVCPIR